MQSHFGIEACQAVSGFAQLVKQRQAALHGSAVHTNTPYETESVRVARVVNKVNDEKVEDLTWSVKVKEVSPPPTQSNIPSSRTALLVPPPARYSTYPLQNYSTREVIRRERFVASANRQSAPVPQALPPVNDLPDTEPVYWTATDFTYTPAYTIFQSPECKLTYDVLEGGATKMFLTAPDFSARMLLKRPEGVESEKVSDRFGRTVFTRDKQKDGEWVMEEFKYLEINGRPSPFIAAKRFLYSDGHTCEITYDKFGRIVCKKEYNVESLAQTV